MNPLHPELMWQLAAEHRRELDRLAHLSSKHPVAKRAAQWRELRRYCRMRDRARPQSVAALREGNTKAVQSCTERVVRGAGKTEDKGGRP
jgi:hypothetical protein